MILFEHNVEHMIWKRLRDVERALWRRTLLEIEWRKMRRYEAARVQRGRSHRRGVGRRSRAAEDLAPRATIRTIPTGVDTAYFHPNGV